MNTMKFCRECNNILYSEEDKEQKILLYACPNCDHQEVAHNNYVYRNEVHHSVAERPQVLQNVAADPTLPRTKDVRCVKGQHGESCVFPGHLLISLILLFILLLIFAVMAWGNHYFKSFLFILLPF